MRTGSEGYHASSSNENEADVRAILFPLSKSAKYSVHLPENKIPSSEANIRGVKRGYGPIVISQSRDKEKFTFGTSLDNDVVLKHPDPAVESWCWINFLHLQLYPDPDGVVILHNESTSTFVVQSLSTKRTTRRVRPHQEARLDCGSWRLQLGKGLDFCICIQPHSPRGELYSQLLLSENAAILYGKPTQKKTKAKPRKESIEAPPPATAKSMGGEILRAGHRGVRAAARQEHLESRPPQGSLNLGEIIGKTRCAKVFKTTRNGMEVAIKVCGGSSAKLSANTWRNEVDILVKLRELDHPCITRLVSYDARTLQIVLEYAGLSLVKFVDGGLMSQLSEDSQHQILLDVSSGLDHIHANNIIHGDLTPQNILYNGTVAKICDFGLSRKDGNLIDHNGGSPCYIPREYLFEGRRGAPADIWAFGVIMLFVSGLIPIPQGNWLIADIFSKPGVQSEMVDWLCKVDKVAARIPERLSLVRLMLADNPKNRITAAELVKNLSPYVELIA